MLEGLTTEPFEGTMDALPMKILLVDENDKLQYWNEADKQPAPADALGKDVRENMRSLGIKS